MGFQRRVWWPKCTPASNRCFIEITAMGFFLLVFSTAGFIFACHRFPGTSGKSTRVRNRIDFITHSYSLQHFFVQNRPFFSSFSRFFICFFDSDKKDGRLPKTGASRKHIVTELYCNEDYLLAAASTSSLVSRAIAISSLVGITQMVTLLSEAEMTAS